MRRSRIKPETLLKRFKTFCVICRRRIPKDRQRRRAVTCKAKCQKLLARYRKIERDFRVCHSCGKPCTPEEKRQFLAFRSSLPTSSHSRKRISGKGIPAVANGIQTLKDIAYVVESGRKSRLSKNLKRGAA